MRHSKVHFRTLDKVAPSQLGLRIGVPKFVSTNVTAGSRVTSILTAARAGRGESLQREPRVHACRRTEP